MHGAAAAASVAACRARVYTPYVHAHPHAPRSDAQAAAAHEACMVRLLRGALLAGRPEALRRLTACRAQAADFAATLLRLLAGGASLGSCQQTGAFAKRCNGPAGPRRLHRGGNVRSLKMLHLAAGHPHREKLLACAPHALCLLHFRSDDHTTSMIQLQCVRPARQAADRPAQRPGALGGGVPGGPAGRRRLPLQGGQRRGRLLPRAGGPHLRCAPFSKP